MSTSSYNESTHKEKREALSRAIYIWINYDDVSPEFIANQLLEFEKIVTGHDDQQE